MQGIHVWSYKIFQSLRFFVNDMSKPWSDMSLKRMRNTSRSRIQRPNRAPVIAECNINF